MMLWKTQTIQPTVTAHDPGLQEAMDEICQFGRAFLMQQYDGKWVCSATRQHRGAEVKVSSKHDEKSALSAALTCLHKIRALKEPA